MSRNTGETRAEREYIRISHLTHLRDAYRILRDVCQPIDPVNIPEEEYREVMRLIDGWVGKLERREKGK